MNEGAIPFVGDLGRPMTAKERKSAKKFVKFAIKSLKKTVSTSKTKV